MTFPRASAVASRLEILEETGSTNADLRARADDPAWTDLAVLLTRNQTAGRGRLDRGWTTPAGTALAVSVLLKDLRPAPAQRGWIPLAAGVAMRDAVAAQLPGHEVGVKWPNDVLVDGRKICGILAEAASDAVVLGSGINTAMTSEQLPLPTATSFAACGVAADEDRLIADYLTRLRELLAPFSEDEQQAARDLLEAVSTRCVSLGREVVVSLPDGAILRGTATRLDPQGRLVVEDPDGEHTVAAGDVVHARLS